MWWENRNNKLSFFKILAAEKKIQPSMHACMLAELLKILDWNNAQSKHRQNFALISVEKKNWLTDWLSIFPSYLLCFPLAKHTSKEICYLLYKERQKRVETKELLGFWSAPVKIEIYELYILDREIALKQRSRKILCPFENIYLTTSSPVTTLGMTAAPVSSVVVVGGELGAELELAEFSSTRRRG